MSRILLAHPSSQLYGADRMLVGSANCLVEAGCDVTVALPSPGSLDEHLRAAGAEIVLCRTAVLRKSALSPLGLLRLAVESVAALWCQIRLIRRVDADVVYANTMTVPTWLLAGRLTRRRVVCHVHEAEDDAGRLSRLLLLLQLILAHEIVCNSQATARFVASSAFARWAPRPVVVHNGIPLSDGLPKPPPVGRVKLLVVGRLSPRKGQDVAIRALAQLVGQGHDVELDLLGDVYEGYESFQQELLRLVQDLDLSGRVRLRGFVADTGPAYETADIVLVPSRVEPFGNVAVEGLSAARPVVASAVQGLVEILGRGGGRLVPADDPPALAAAISALLELPDTEFLELGRLGSEQVRARFSEQQYGRGLLAVLLPPRGRCSTNSTARYEVDRGNQ
ncbi:glycosyltransferase [Aeromicrobium sp.]|uniref:glycosyltransferase n=1 Tax=Aeromicrobium sp. TaxID=1871063 RepID=UPI0019C1BE89|nr:glycosyltransferase [Aeromicrobium sp.]MBC7630446.1 glycosyltransferase [Aeromicrobium sp.]